MTKLLQEVKNEGNEAMLATTVELMLEFKQQLENKRAFVVAQGSQA